jgi:hypothetical protein
VGVRSSPSLSRPEEPFRSPRTKVCSPTHCCRSSPFSVERPLSPWLDRQSATHNSHSSLTWRSTSPGLWVGGHSATRPEDTTYGSPAVGELELGEVAPFGLGLGRRRGLGCYRPAPSAVDRRPECGTARLGEPTGIPPENLQIRVLRPLEGRRPVLGGHSRWRSAGVRPGGSQ